MNHFNKTETFNI